MAVAAARDCLKGVDRAAVGGVYFASTTAPYKEKQSAATIASVLELPPDAVDHGLRRLSALRHQRAQGGAGRRGERQRRERAGLRRRHPPRVPRPAPAR